MKNAAVGCVNFQLIWRIEIFVAKQKFFGAVPTLRYFLFKLRKERIYSEIAGLPYLLPTTQEAATIKPTCSATSTHCASGLSMLRI